MSKENVLKSKSFDFAIRIIKLNQYLRKQYREFVLSQQVLKSGTSVGANVREAEHAQSRKDFLNKLNIGLKEINECVYWLELLFITGYISKKMFESIIKVGEELLRLLIASVKTTKKRSPAK